MVMVSIFSVLLFTRVEAGTEGDEERPSRECVSKAPKCTHDEVCDSDDECKSSVCGSAADGPDSHIFDVLRAGEMGIRHHVHVRDELRKSRRTRLTPKRCVGPEGLFPEAVRETLRADPATRWEHPGVEDLLAHARNLREQLEPLVAHIHKRDTAPRLPDNNFFFDDKEGYISPGLRVEVDRSSSGHASQTLIFRYCHMCNRYYDDAPGPYLDEDWMLGEGADQWDKEFAEEWFQAQRNAWLTSFFATTNEGAHTHNTGPTDPDTEQAHVPVAVAVSSFSHDSNLAFLGTSNLYTRLGLGTALTILFFEYNKMRHGMDTAVTMEALSDYEEPARRVSGVSVRECAYAAVATGFLCYEVQKKEGNSPAKVLESGRLQDVSSIEEIEDWVEAIVRGGKHLGEGESLEFSQNSC